MQDTQADASHHTATLLLDAGHESCGSLLVLIYQHMQRLAPGQVLEVVGYDPGAWVDIAAWCRMTGHTLLEARGEPWHGEAAHYFIRKRNEP